MMTDRIDFEPFHASTKAESFAEWLCGKSRAFRKKWLDKITKKDLLDLKDAWAFWQRPEQRPPKGNWRTWLVMAGRGFGKTRMGAEWVKEKILAAGVRIALIGASIDEVRKVMIEGESGLLAHCRPKWRPRWEPSLGRLTWPNGSTAHVYTAAEPDGLRGPQFHAAWCDEIAKWPRAEEAWANIEFATRLGKHPQIMATTTPRPLPLVRQLVAEAAA